MSVGFWTWMSQPSFWFQPVFYALHGWFATEMAIILLFRPYTPWMIAGWTLPGTPGVLPRRKKQLAIAIADTITKSVLTVGDIQQKAQGLIAEDRIERALNVVGDALMKDIENPAQIRRLYKGVEQILPPFMGRLTEDLIDSLDSGNTEKFDKLFDEWFDWALERIYISPGLAELIANTIFSTLVTPAFLRENFVEVLTKENVELLQRNVRSRVSGWQALIMLFVNVDKSLYEFRDFLIEQPTASEEMILQMLDHSEIREKLIHRLESFAPDQFQPEIWEEFKVYMRQATKNFLKANKEPIIAGLTSVNQQFARSFTRQLLERRIQRELIEHFPKLQKELAKFIQPFLSRQLDQLIERMLKTLDINSLIADKIVQFSAQEMEQVARQVCQRELRWLAILGGILGFWLGLLSNFIVFHIK